MGGREIGGGQPSTVRQVACALTLNKRPSARMSMLPCTGRFKGTDASCLMYEDRPCLRFYGKVPTTLACPEITLYEALAATAPGILR
jgi:hypothetical protein